MEIWKKNENKNIYAYADTHEYVQDICLYEYKDTEMRLRVLYPEYNNMHTHTQRTASICHKLKDTFCAFCGKFVAVAVTVLVYA